jgi:hypothetical protein
MMLSLYVTLGSSFADGSAQPVRPSLRHRFRSMVEFCSCRRLQPLYGIDGDNAPYDDSRFFRASNR